MDSLWLEKCMISQSFEPSRESRGRVAKVLVQKLLRVVEAEKQGLKNRVWPPFGGMWVPNWWRRKRKHFQDELRLNTRKQQFKPRNTRNLNEHVKSNAE